MSNKLTDDGRARLSAKTKASWSEDGDRRVFADERQTFAGRVAVLIAALTADLGGDPSQTTRSLISMAATLTARAEMLQAALLRDEPVDDDTVVRVNNAAARMLDKLGVKIRRGRDIEAELDVPWTVEK